MSYRIFYPAVLSMLISLKIVVLVEYANVKGSSEINRVWLRYEKNKYTNKLNYKPQARARVCEENEEENKKRLSLKIWKPVEEQ